MRKNEAWLRICRVRFSRRRLGMYGTDAPNRRVSHRLELLPVDIISLPRRGRVFRLTKPTYTSSYTEEETSNNVSRGCFSRTSY